MKQRIESPIVSKTEVCEWIGITMPSLEKHLDVLVPSGSGYDLKASIRGYCGKMRNTAANRSGDEGENLNLTVERARLARVQAEAHELKLAMARGEVLDADEVRRMMENDYRQVRSGMLAVVPRMGQDAGLSPVQLRALDQHIRGALAVLADDENG